MSLLSNLVWQCVAISLSLGVYNVSLLPSALLLQSRCLLCSVCLNLSKALIFQFELKHPTGRHQLPPLAWCNVWICYLTWACLLPSALQHLAVSQCYISLSALECELFLCILQHLAVSQCWIWLSALECEPFLGILPQGCFRCTVCMFSFTLFYIPYFFQFIWIC